MRIGVMSHKLMASLEPLIPCCAARSGSGCSGGSQAASRGSFKRIFVRMGSQFTRIYGCLCVSIFTISLNLLVLTQV